MGASPGTSSGSDGEPLVAIVERAASMKRTEVSVGASYYLVGTVSGVVDI